MVFDSISRYGWPQGGASQRARHRAWNLAHRATAQATRFGAEMLISENNQLKKEGGQ